MNDWERIINREFCSKYYGNLSQLMGLKNYSLKGGKADGVDAIEVRTGSGLEYTVLPGRGMDIAWASYRGIPVSFLSQSGIVSPKLFDPYGQNAMKSFFGGLITTCGLQNVGTECTDAIGEWKKITFCMHGDISNIHAENISMKEYWQDGTYIMSVSGRVRESMFLANNLIMERTITSFSDKNVIQIDDVFENEMPTPVPLMLLYHINFCYPIFGVKSEFLAPIRNEKMINASMNSISEPLQGNAIIQKEYQLEIDSNGRTVVALINPELELGICLRFDANQLDHFMQLSCCSIGDYYMAFEPCNIDPQSIGNRIGQKEAGKLKWLTGYEQKTVSYQIEIIDGAENISRIKNEISLLMGKKEEQRE